MGSAAELCAKEYNISRAEQDEYAIESYHRAESAYKNGAFKLELISVEVPNGKDKIMVSEDEEWRKVKYDKIATLRPAFQKDGTITAANASKINDGATAMILASADKVKELGLKPICKITGFADAAQAPEWFTTTPSLAVPKALKMAGKEIKEIDFFELNEAFSVVNIANNRILGIDNSKANIYGGAVSLGHPIGNSGARIIATLAAALKNNSAKLGAAGICNGGGGASAMVIENV